MRRLFLASLAALPLLAACTASEVVTPASRVVFFTQDDVTLDDAAKGVVAEAAEVAKRHPSTTVRVAGFSDPAPTPVPGGNTRLSDLRARAVAAELRADGVAPARIIIQPRGATTYESVPVESRRVEINISN
ncbi:OmpA family protein [Roseomonas elaeocarpi]|uniref:OmpA family protein n=1 Tax=Roseomonas elaeocarpi TaxID=907779 RepID=A0ABV6JYS5_9PROT